MKPILLLFSFILLAGCKNHNLVENTEFFIIDLEQCLSVEREMKISEIADTVKYLELKTPEDVLISRIHKIIPADDFLLVRTVDGYFKFTWEGEFIKEIGRSGQGPGEYINGGNDVVIDPTRKEIIISDIKQVLFYNFDGIFLRSEPWRPLFKIELADSVLWACNFSLHIDEYIAFALNQKGDTVAFIPNPIYGMESLNEGIHGFLPIGTEFFYHYNNSFYLKGPAENDTIYKLSGATRIPHAFINRGKYVMPTQYASWYSWDAFEKNGDRYWGVIAAIEDDHYLYLNALKFSTKSGDNRRFIVYDKESGQGSVVQGKEGHKITDDILGGPSIWPRWTTDDYYIDIIEPYDLFNAIKENKSILSPAFEKQVSGFSYGTNQLLILCQKKK